MAKSAAPLLIGLGAAALLLGGKKKKKSAPKRVDIEGFSGDPLTDAQRANLMDPSATNFHIVLDQECMEITKKINPTAHNSWMTSRFQQMLSEGWEDPKQITIQLLVEQSEHCPWKDDPSSWTPMMAGLYNQLVAAVTEYYNQFVGTIDPDLDPASGQ